MARCPRWMRSRFLELKQEYDSLSDDSFRVLAVATKELSGKQISRRKMSATWCSRDMSLSSILPGDGGPRPGGTAQPWRQRKILTGDNPLISRKYAGAWAFRRIPLLLGSDVEKVSDVDLAEAADEAVLFSRLSPAHKERVIRALRGKGHVVGFIGDGINDAPAARLRIWGSPWTTP